MPVKRCAWGTCNADSRYPDRYPGTTFIPFAKPKRQLEKCLRWIKACNRPHTQLSVHRITQNTYVCSRHFVDGQPTQENPDPVLEVSVLASAGSQQKRRPPSKQSLSPTSKKIKTTTSDTLVELQVLQRTPQVKKSTRLSARERNRIRRRKIKTFKTHSKSCDTEESHPAFFCQKHLAMPAASVLLHDYDGPIDSSVVVDSSNGQRTNVEGKAPMLRTVTHQSQQSCPRKGTWSLSKLLRARATSETETVMRLHQQQQRKRTQGRRSGLSSQGNAGMSNSCKQESPESALTSDAEIEIDVAEDPTQLLKKTSRQKVSDGYKSTMPDVKPMKTEPANECNYHHALCEEEAGTEQPLVSRETPKFSTEVKQEKDMDLCSDSKTAGTDWFHASEHGMDIKQEHDMDVCSHGEDSSTEWYQSMEIKEERDLVVSQPSEAIEQFQASELCVEIKQEKDDDYSGCEYFGSELFSACEVDKIKQEKDVGVYTSCESSKSEQFHSPKHGKDTKQEKNVDVSSHSEAVPIKCVINQFHTNIESEFTIEIKQEKVCKTEVFSTNNLSEFDMEIKDVYAFDTE